MKFYTNTYKVLTTCFNCGYILGGLPVLHFIGNLFPIDDSAFKEIVVHSGHPWEFKKKEISMCMTILTTPPNSHKGVPRAGMHCIFLCIFIPRHFNFVVLKTRPRNREIFMQKSNRTLSNYRHVIFVKIYWRRSQPLHRCKNKRYYHLGDLVTNRKL